MWQETDLALLAVFERYHHTHNITLALVKGTINKGAIATSWAHDHHNLMVIGKNIEDMIKAQHTIVDKQGGYAVVNNQEILAFAHLNIGGIVSDLPIAILSKQLKEVREKMQELGYKHDNEIMSLSTLSLPVSPEIKVTDKGILNTRTQTILPLVEENHEN